MRWHPGRVFPARRRLPKGKMLRRVRDASYQLEVGICFADGVGELTCLGHTLRSFLIGEGELGFYGFRVRCVHPIMQVK